MRRKLKIFVPILLAWGLSFFISIKLGIVITALLFLALCFFVIFSLLNMLVKKTNWWKNQYKATEQFVSNEGYRDNIIRNYDVVNLGSNPARFAFFYDKVKGQSWATGSQGQDMDFEILKYYHSYLKKGATVLIPIMPFTAISTYLKERPEYWDMTYYSKFAKILDKEQVNHFPGGNVLRKYLKNPLRYNKGSLRYVFCDVQLDNRYQLAEQPMMKMELEQDANKWVVGWLKEFKIRNLNDVLEDRWKKYYDEALELNKRIVEFCLERDLKPVFICVPMTKHLSDLFPVGFYQHMIKDFVNQANCYNIPFLDYTYNESLQDDSLYFNSFFLNLKGRKLFTRQVLNDLGIRS